MHKNFIIENFAYRLSQYHPGRNIQIGCGNTDADILVVQLSQKMPERDAITGALKNFDMLDDSYRATMNIIDLPEPTQGRALSKNRECLLELIEIIRPLVVVACGVETMSILAGRNIRSFDRHTGKKFQVGDLTNCLCYATINPAEYGFARASQALKSQGKAEWTKLAALYNKLKSKKEQERWTC